MVDALVTNLAIRILALLLPGASPPTPEALILFRPISVFDSWVPWCINADP